MSHREERRTTRITCLATHGGHAGGAAIAMERLAAGLRVAGAHVDVVTRGDCDWPPLVRQIDRRIRRHIRHGRTPLSNTLFTADWPAWDLSGHPSVVAADLVNLHWVAGFVNAEGVRGIVASGRPVVWTLHDMRAFTGGCHYAAGCGGFTGGCAACPQLVPELHPLARRSHARARLRLRGIPLTFVAPSRWLAGEAGRSSLFDPAAHAIRVIPYGIDLERFRPGDRAAARTRLGLPQEGLGILLGGVSLEERRKGGEVAVEAIRRMQASLAAGSTKAPPPFVVTYGAGAAPIPGVACRHLGTVDEGGVREAIHASDVHLTMAREDNLPNTVMEALACGVPVLAARAGGIPEMVSDGRTGWLVDVDDAAAAGATLARLVLTPDEVLAAGRGARRRAMSEWDLSLQAARYLELARELAVDRPRLTDQEPSWAPREVPTSGLTDSGAASVRRRGGIRSGSGRVRGSALTPAVAPFAHPVSRLRGPLRRVRRLGSPAPRKIA